MMVQAPSTFLLAIPSQLATRRFIVVKSKQENCRQESDQQHGLKSCHLLVFLWCRGCVLCLGDEGVEGQL
jgi:hypothetical protein